MLSRVDSVVSGRGVMRFTVRRAFKTAHVWGITPGSGIKRGSGRAGRTLRWFAGLILLGCVAGGVPAVGEVPPSGEAADLPSGEAAETDQDISAAGGEASGTGRQGAAEEAGAVSFVGEIEPIFRQQCYGCHQAAKRLGDYRMNEFSALLAGGESGEPAIVPGKPEQSYLVGQIVPDDGGHAEMPKPPGKPLSPDQVALIVRWIREGATDDSPVTDDGPLFDAEHPPVYLGPPTLPSADVSPDGSLVAVAGFHEVRLIELASGNLHSRLVGLSPRINSVRFSPQGDRLVAAGGTPGEAGELQIWDVATGELRLSEWVTFDTLTGAAWSPDGRQVSFGGTDNVVRVIDAESGERLLYQGAHEDWVRDTVFTPDGNHVVSVARDMSCKLTEVETERFIDNITSITPGALSGGLSSVAMHPERNEILVGGADGVAKLYRVFRQTERRIGDDANLIRAMPPLPGRIFGVAISPDGSRFAALATIDNRSEVRVWEYDFDGELGDELKAILAKRVSDQTPEERQKADEHRRRQTPIVGQFVLDDTAAYAIRFAPDNRLVMTAADGTVRVWDDASGQLSLLHAIPIDAAERPESAAPAPRRWLESGPSVAAGSATEADDGHARPGDGEPLPKAGQVVGLSVEPSELLFTSPYDYAQLVVTATLTDGRSVDVTHASEYVVPDGALAIDSGLVRPATDAEGVGRVRFGEREAEFTIRGEGIGDASVDFRRDVNPVLSRAGCNQGTCHGAQQGRNGFRLSLRGYDPVFDRRALTDDLKARRINPASPEDSLMLRKPLGLTPHEGGVLMTYGDPYHTILRRWIADGSRVDLASPKVERLEIFPQNPVVGSTSGRQQVRVVAYDSAGGQRDVTREAFIESGDTEIANVAPGGVLRALRRGEAAVLARYEGAYAATTLTVMGDRGEYVEPSVETWGTIDELVADKWRRVKVMPSGLADDATFLRRVSLDLTGLPPTSDQVREFLNDPRPTRVKRSEVIDRLINSDEFIDYWTNKWADLLQVNRKFLGVEGSEKLRDWIRASIAEDVPYDEFVRRILTATGSNHDNPAASYFKILRNPEDTMENTTHLFLGIRFNCNKCHDHPFERWTQDQYYEMAAFFARVGLQPDPAAGDRKIGGTAVEGAKPLFERVVDSDQGEIRHPNTNEVVEPEFPYDVDAELSPGTTRREALAAWMTHPDNPYFAKSYVNRLWGYLLGRGLIEPIDDLRAGNPPTNPELLDFLTQSFIDSGFDFRHMLRLITNSRVYQLSIESHPLNEDDVLNYARGQPRRLPAEVIYDAVHAATGAAGEIPGMPRGTRAAALTDAGVKLADGFLQNLGRPVRESACECERSSELQLGPVMALINGPTIGAAISDPENEMERLVQESENDQEVAEELFLRLLGRYPTADEVEAYAQLIGEIGRDHERLVARLEAAEAAWGETRAELEAQRLAKLKETEAKIEERQAEIRPERERAEAERQSRIERAEATLAETQAGLETRATEWLAEQAGLTGGVAWVPLMPAKAESTGEARLAVRQDRSVVATGKRDKQVYTLEFTSDLPRITGLRLEALADPDLPSQGPGLGGNGNFVLTELEVLAGPAGGEAESQAIAFAGATADFTQPGFSIDATFNGQKRDQQGWAVSGATGVDHWATYRFAEPIVHDGGTRLVVSMHQFHNAADHRLGRFRISVTTADGEIPLGLPDTLAAVAVTPEAARQDADRQRLNAYVGATDEPLRKAKAALAEAKKPLPPDGALVSLEQLRERLSSETPDDPRLVQLREDVRHSERQLERERLTAAEDLTWALINSPAFLFNH